MRGRNQMRHGLMEGQSVFFLLLVYFFDKSSLKASKSTFCPGIVYVCKTQLAYSDILMAVVYTNRPRSPALPDFLLFSDIFRFMSFLSFSLGNLVTILRPR